MAFTLYSASAGSGKTYTLVNEYLSLTLPDPHAFGQTLAVTFTNKAANEMKERIISALLGICLGQEKSRQDELQRTTGLSEPQLKQNAATLINHILHQYGDYAVMTIDSFILRVVRAFALDLGLPLRFDVEMSRERAPQLIIERLIARARPDNTIGKILARFIIDKLRTEQSWQYEQSLHQVTMKLFDDTSQEAISALEMAGIEVLMKAEQELNGQQSEFIQAIRGILSIILQHVASKDLQIADFSHRESGIYGQLLRLQQAVKPADFEPKARLQNGEWFNAKSQQKEQYGEFFLETIEPLRLELLGAIATGLPRYQTIWHIKRNLPTLLLLSELSQELVRLHHQDNLVPIGLFNRKVARVIAEEVVPYIYLRIGERFTHYLIDEFQDTSRLQWHNLFPLIENVIAEGHACLAVGDPKQSIYRWRGGDPQIMEQDIAISLPSGQVRQRSLKKNYRSSTIVVDFNNRFFGDFMLPPLIPALQRFSAPYVHQEEVGTDGGGYVEVRFFDKPKAESEPDTTNPTIAWTLAQIRRCLESGVSASEIAVLVRTHSESALLSHELLLANIPFIAPDARQLRLAREVRAIIAILAYLHSHEDIHLLETLGFLKNEAFAEFLAQLPSPDALHEEINTLLPAMQAWLHRPFALSLYDLGEEIAAALAPFTDNPTALLAFLEVLYKQSGKLGGDLKAFLDWWQEHQEAPETTMANTDTPQGVQVLTIHKAKGLEFNVVLLPFADWPIVTRSMSSNPSLWVWDNDNQLGDIVLPYLIPVSNEEQPSLFAKELMAEHEANRIDNLNLLYVAFTRAKQMLLIACSDAGEKTVANWILQRVQSFATEHSDGLFTFGDWQPKISAKTKPAQIIPLDTLHTSAWQNRLVVRHQAQDEWLSQHDPRHEGKQLHWIMSHIRYEEDLQPALLAAQENGIIGQEMIPELCRHFHALQDLPLFGARVRDFFNPPWQIRTEATILAGGERKRPDRIQFHQEQIVVIDYKRESAHHSHRPQLREYMTLLAACYPKMHIRGALLYILGSEVQEIDAPFTQGGLNR